MSFFCASFSHVSLRKSADLAFPQMARKRKARSDGSALRGFVTSWGSYATIWAA